MLNKKQLMKKFKIKKQTSNNSQNKVKQFLSIFDNLKKKVPVVDGFKKTTKVIFIIFAVLNILGPILIFLWPNLMSHMIFQHFIHIPFKNLSNPSAFGLNHTYSFKIEHDDIEIGAWHILPQNSMLEISESIEGHFSRHVEKLSENSQAPIVVLYLHGNTNDRSTGHRVQLYHLLKSMNYHTVAIDYRGYGDSSGEPTEDDVVKDALFTYEFIEKHVPWAKIYIWGHSLGTGVSSRLARILTEKGKPAAGVILEAPFNNIVEEVEFHPFTWAWPYNPFFYRAIEDALKSLNLQFRSDIHLTQVKSKIMIMHSEDDLIIPIYQAEKLYETVSKRGISEKVLFHKIPSSYGLGHNRICRAPNIIELIQSFIH